jgi:hypothetical protein
MKNIFIGIICLLTSLNFQAQSNLTDKAKPIVEEGIRLYKSEMASWNGTDLFLEQFTETDKIGGYFSYSEGDDSKCIFYSKGENPEVLGCIIFDTTFSTETAVVDLKTRPFTKNEQALFEIRNLALNEINANELFQSYENTNFNLIPIISGDKKKVYILTGPKKSGVVIFGNDYLITFKKNNKIAKIKTLHKNILPIEYGGDKNENAVGAMHSHLPETGDFITATDICTIMLYSKYTKWKTYTVISEKYINIWNCETNTLIVLTTEAFGKIMKDQEQRNKK